MFDLEEWNCFDVGWFCVLTSPRCFCPFSIPRSYGLDYASSSWSTLYIGRLCALVIFITLVDESYRTIYFRGTGTNLAKAVLDAVAESLR